MCAAKDSMYVALLTHILVVLESFVRPLGGIWGTPWETFGRPFEPLERSRSSYIRLSRALMCAPGPPRAPKEDPRAPKEAPRASKRAPRGLQEASERLQEPSKRTPRRLQEASKRTPTSKSNRCPGGFRDVSSGSRESICFKL